MDLCLFDKSLLGELHNTNATDLLPNENINLPLLFVNIKLNDLYIIKIILRKNIDNINYKNELGETLIHIAVKYNFKEMIKWLISEGLDINSIDYSGRTALHLAVARRNEDMIKYLLECKASINVKDLYGKSPFHMVTQFGNIKIIKLFLQHGADVLDITSITHQTAFHISLQNEDKKSFKLLLKNHVGNINVADEYGETLLHILARQRNEYLAKLLLEKGADLEIINKDNETALHFAIHNRNFNTSKLFIEHGANVNAKNKYGESPLHLAIRYKDLKLVNLLIKNNADVNECTNDYNTMLHIAINYYNEDIVNLLIESGIIIERRNKYDLDSFHLAIKNNCIDGAKILLKNGIDINCKTFGKFIVNHCEENNKYRMYTPLHTAILQKNIDAVKFLLENGARLHLNQEHEIFLAVKTGCSLIVECLIKNGADVNAINSLGQSVLFVAMESRNRKEVQMLLRNGAHSDNINETGKEGETALHLAVKAKDEKFVEFLLNLNIDINICNRNNSTALALARGNSNIANLLIKNIALLKVNKLFICPQNKAIIETVSEFKEYFLECLEELKKIQNTIFCNVSLMNFLIKNQIFLVKCVRQEALVNDFNTKVSNKNFPIYYCKLLEKMNKTLERWKLLKNAKNVLYSTTSFKPLYDVLDEIVNHFSNVELENFIEII